MCVICGKNHKGGSMKTALSHLVALLLTIFLVAHPTLRQSGYTLWGDVKIDDSKAANPGPSSVTVVLYDPSTRIVGRQTIGARGRYRITNLRGGENDLAIESDA